MKQTFFRIGIEAARGWLLGLGAAAVILMLPAAALAVSPPPQNPQNGAVGLEGTISAPPPSLPATISTPISGRSFSDLPVTVNGLCPDGVMVKMFSNNIFIGSVSCANGSYSLQVDLFSGQNQLVARVYDNLDQAGPDSNTVTVSFTDASLSAFESRVSLTSAYAKRGANPGETLSWPVILSGGTGPYALSVDWGDGKPVTLQSEPFAGSVDLDHVYDTAGIYRIIVKATDAKGSTAYLQLIGVGNGAVSASGSKTKDQSSATITVTKTKYSAIPSLVAIPLILTTFWLGRKYELQVLRRKIEASTASEYNQ